VDSQVEYWTRRFRLPPDALGSVVERLVRHQRKYDPSVAKWKTWVGRIVKNRALTARKERPPTAAQWDSERHPEPEDKSAPPRDGPESSELRSAILDCIARIEQQAPQQAAALRMRYELDAMPTEAARQMGIGRDAYREAWGAGAKKLRLCLEQRGFHF
jgi:RNA polymerase sigma factor (sigma-70 family)